jgi:arylsulfatase A-like enzyme
VFRRFNRSLAVGCAGALSAAVIDTVTGFVAAASRFDSPAFVVAAALSVFLLALIAFIAVRWVLMAPLRTSGEDADARSVAAAMGVAAFFVTFNIGHDDSTVLRAFNLLLDIVLGVAVGAGAYALALTDSRTTRLTLSRRVGRTLPFAMAVALPVAWLAFVVVDDVTSGPFVLLALAFAAVTTGIALVAGTFTPQRWQGAVWIVTAAIVAGGAVGALVTSRDETLVAGTRTAGGDVRRVILLTVDTLRRDAISCYGSTTIATPNIDRLAADGVLFEHVEASSSWTLPSFASMFTGLTVRGHGVDTGAAALPDTLTTLAECFRRAGYATHAFVGNAMLAPHRGFAQGFQRYHLPERAIDSVCLGEAMATRLRPRPMAEETATRDITDAAIAWTDAHRNDDFFLWVHYLDPHLPYAPPAEQVERMNVHDELGFTLDITSATRPTMDLFGTPERRVWAKSLYDGEVRYVDAEIGRLLDALQASGIYDDALIVFSVDHGEEFWDHDGFEHGHTLYEELVAVPLIFKTPGTGAARMVDGTVAIYDVAPTVLELVGLETPATQLAVSLADVVAGLAPAPSRPVFASGTLFRSNFESVVFEGWKYIRSATSGREELYRLTDDPGERSNLALDYPDMIKRGRALIDEHARATEAFRATHRISNPNIKLDADEVERLRALGYL